MKKLLLFTLILFMACSVQADTSKNLVCIRFTQDTAYGVYSDSLFFTETEYALLSKPQVDAIKQTRVDKWIEIKKNPPSPEEESLSELRTQEMTLRADLNIVIGLLADRVSKAELEDMKAEYISNATMVQNKIDDRSLHP